MDPHKPMMPCCERDEWSDTMMFGRVIIGRETFKQTVECFSLGRYVHADRYRAVTNDSCFYPLLLIVITFHPTKAFWQAAIESFVNPREYPWRRNIQLGFFRNPLCQFLLNFYVDLAFDLQISLILVSRVVLPHGPLYIDRMSAVTFNEIAVITVYNPQQFLDPGERWRRKATFKLGRHGDHIARQVFQLFGAGRVERLHLSNVGVHIAA